eukprot:CAMPEP_0179450702 /NCGR_PEP_ID=MMETSP0799-20121207/34683_1 /TAXON_ID=46947 /ORGANISM="Geminigera cryophila, Strain CCMP2564" /LENGTH=81 /DNA_ID=CAMNT_0021245079 /DNA_START=225 /DNA_END=471 /DNA_ORIENTATION=+
MPDPTGNRDDVDVAKVLRLDAPWQQPCDVIVVAKCTMSPMPNVHRATSFVTARVWKWLQTSVSTGDPPNAASDPTSVGASL